MRTYEDNFSGQRIYPGKGKLFIRGDSKVFRFQNSKSESLFLQRKNPRRIAWTVLFRKQHKKGVQEESAKKRTRRTIKSQRAIVGVTLEEIKARRTAAQNRSRETVIAEGKKKAAAEKEKRAKAKKAAAVSGAHQAQRIQSKQGAKGAPVKVQATSR